MKLVIFLLTYAASIFLSQITLATDVVATATPEANDFLVDLAKGEFWAKFLGIMVGVQMLLYGLATGLTKIAVYTDTKWDNKVAGVISQLAWVIGSFLGKFGYSVPKPVLEAKAEEMQNGKETVIKTN